MTTEEKREQLMKKVLDFTGEGTIHSHIQKTAEAVVACMDDADIEKHWKENNE